MYSSDSLDLSLRKLVVLRIAVATLILASGAIIYFLSGNRTAAFYSSAVLAIFYLNNLLYVIFEPLFSKYPLVLKYLVILTDVLLSSALIYLTGGRSSPFIFLYPLIIVFSSILISRIASYISASICIVIFLIMVFYQLHAEEGFRSFGEFIKSGVLSGRGNTLSLYLYLISFILIAALGGYLSERLTVAKRQLGESNKTLDILKNLHENILQSLTSGVVTLDLEEKVVSINRYGIQILNIKSEAEIINKKFDSFIIGISVGELVNKKREQVSYFTPEGKNLILGLSASLLKDGTGEVHGYTVIFQDLTEIISLEEKLKSTEKMAILGQLAGGLAHELRNPLSAISGAIEILSSEVIQSESSYRMSKIASREIDRLNMMVEDFLLLTMPYESFNSNFVDLSYILNEAVSSFSSTVNRSNLKIDLEVEKGTLIEVDSYRLKQVFWNLLDNSMDSMPNGGKIHVKCYSEKDVIKILFSDEGTGIKEENISKIFDPFFTTKEVGTGLGLAIVQKVVESYNGNVSVTSRMGKGTEFILSLPKPQNL